MDSSRTPDREVDLPSYIAERLHGTIFSAWYTDRLWIEDLSAYRDQIQIDAVEERTIKVFKSVHRRLKKASNSSFTGISKSNDLISIFVDWSKDSQVMGHYWFIINSTNLDANHRLTFDLRILRPVAGGDQNVSGAKCPHCGKLPIQDSMQKDDPLNLSEIASQLQWKFRDVIKPTEWWTDVKPHLTLDNVLKTIKFVFVLVLAAVSGTANFILHIASHTDRIVHALSGLIRTCTPFLLACVDTFNRVIAGFFTLIAMMWKDVRRPQENANRLAYERNDSARNKFLEGPTSYPRYRPAGVNRPYL